MAMSLLIFRKIPVYHTKISFDFGSIGFSLGNNYSNYIYLHGKTPDKKNLFVFDDSTPPHLLYTTVQNARESNVIAQCVVGWLYAGALMRYIILCLRLFTGA